MNEVELLTEMLRIPSVSTREHDLAVFLTSAAGKLGLHAHVDDAGNIVAQAGSGPREVLLLGHMDTVDGEIPVRLEGGKLYGRGAVDAKGPLAAFLCALSRVKERLGDKCVTVVGAVEEEHHTSKGARHLCETMKPGLIVIGEPSGLSTLTLGYKGTLQLRYEAVSSMTHSAAGSGAYDDALSFYAAAKAYVDRLNEGKAAMQRIDLRVRKLHAEQSPFEEHIALHLGFRLPLGTQPQSLADALKDIADGRLQVLSAEVPFQGEKNTPLVRAFLRVLRQNRMEPRFTFKSGTSDMNVVGPHFNVPIVAYGPGDSSLDHTPQEHIVIEEYLKAIDVLEQVLLEL